MLLYFVKNKDHSLLLDSTCVTESVSSYLTKNISYLILYFITVG